MRPGSERPNVGPVPACDPLVEAVYEHRLFQRTEQLAQDPGLQESQRSRAVRARDTCIRIGERVDREQRQLIEILRAEGLDVEPGARSGPRQNHTTVLNVGSHADADRVADRLASNGFERWERWTWAAHESFGRFGDQMTIARTTDVSTVVRIVWGAGRPRSALRRVVVPTAGDWNMIDLPRRAWPAYSLVRPVRLVLERTGLRPRHEDGLGPFMATPDSLIDPLLDFASVGGDDHVVDIGCGDGRLVVDAAARRGCRALGIERSPELAEAARARSAAAGVDELVRIVCGDARTVGLGDASVVFMFLPIDVAAHLIGDTLRSLRPGARLVVHEQMRLPDSVVSDPAETSVLIGDDGVTVAHRWTAGHD